jgi:hypothetical protein
MRLFPTAPALAALCAAAVMASQAAAVVPPAGTATLSLIDTSHVEIVYRNRDVVLQPATLPQVVAAMAAVHSVPAGPWNPGLVDAALSTLGIQMLRARSCWPDDGSFVILPTSPAGVADEALRLASSYYDPNTQPAEFARSYWSRVFQHIQATGPPPGWPGVPALEALKQSIVDAVPFPANLGTMEQYQARGVVPFLHVSGDYDRVCFLFVCWYMPQCKVRFRATSEGYGLRDVK